MAIESTLHTLSNYIYTNPKYNTIINIETVLIPENYTYTTSLNGTYDKYFPLYALNTNSPFNTELIDYENNSVSLTGYIGVRPVSSKYKERYIGNKFNSNDTNIQQKKVTYTRSILPALNPTLSHIQLTNSDTPVPQYLIKILGNYSTAREYGASKLPIKGSYSIQEFKQGDLVIYNNVLWECIENTLLYPPETTEEANTIWKVPNLELQNIFNAQVFAMSGNTCVYIKQAKDTNRRFNPNDSSNSDLVCWNLSYYE